MLLSRLFPGVRDGAHGKFHRTEIAQDVGRRPTDAADRAWVEHDGFAALDISDAIDMGAVLMPVTHEVVIAGQGHGLGVMGVVHDKNTSQRQIESPIDPVICHQTIALVGDAREVKQIACIIAVDYMNW